ncbi:cytochrome P450 [Stipitochalara longipes BDJ]|nr:cytochrome P450 [Stipitochalara longipes BDJ]
MLQTIATAIVAFLAPLLLFIWLKAPSYTSDEPAPIPYTIPFLGNAMSFTSDNRKFMDKSSASVNGRPFSMLVAGRKHYVFTDLADITTIHKTKTLDIKNFVKMLMSNLFGMSEKEAIKLGNIKPAIHELNTAYLLTSKNNVVEASRYFNLLHKVFNALDEEIKDTAVGSVTKDGFVFVADTQGTASVQAYFGQTLLDLNPKILMDLTMFAGEGFWPLLSGAPTFFFPRPLNARERAVRNLEDLVKMVEQDESLTSPFIAARIKVLKEQGMGENTIARELFSILFGSNGNSIPTAYLALLRILYHPGLLANIRQELQDAGYGSLMPGEYVSLFPLGLPLLRSTFWECVRMGSVVSTIREVLEPTELVSGDRIFKLKKGGVVTVPPCLVHMNSSLHPEPHVFKPWRFMSKELGGDGENHTKTLKPFGGGNSYCPGRVFAEKQVMGFLAEMCWRYDITILDKETFVIPDNANFHYAVKCPRAILELKLRA